MCISSSLNAFGLTKMEILSIFQSNTLESEISSRKISFKYFCVTMIFEIKFSVCVLNNRATLIIVFKHVHRDWSSKNKDKCTSNFFLLYRQMLRVLLRDSTLSLGIDTLTFSVLGQTFIVSPLISSIDSRVYFYMFNYNEYTNRSYQTTSWWPSRFFWFDGAFFWFFAFSVKCPKSIRGKWGKGYTLTLNLCILINVDNGNPPILWEVRNDYRQHFSYAEVDNFFNYNIFEFI